MLCLRSHTATSELYTLSLHDALPICLPAGRVPRRGRDLRATSPPGRRDCRPAELRRQGDGAEIAPARSEEHTSELQSHVKLVCRLLLEKKKLLQARLL